MLGAIIGDIAGSSYEVKEVLATQFGGGKLSDKERSLILKKEVPLFLEESCYTGNSVSTIAIADSILHDKSYEESLREWGMKEQQLGPNHWGKSRFESEFENWLEGDYQGKIHGKEAAIRVSPIGYFFEDLIEVEKQARLATISSHNHTNSITAALAVASTIFLVRNGISKQNIAYYLSLRFHYRLNYDLKQLREENTITNEVSDSVPQAIYCFMIANDFEDGIRKSISIGVDAAITGSMLEAYYGVPEELKEKAMTYLTPEQVEIVNQFYAKQKSKEKIISYERNRGLVDNEE